MKRIIALMSTVLLLLWALPASAEMPVGSRTISAGVWYAESVLPYDGGLFISNFGSETPLPAAGENAGFILYEKEGRTKTIIPADGRLHQPTGMAVKGDYLFVADLTDVKVFQLSAPEKAPQVIHFPETDHVVNAMAAEGNTLYVTLTNPGAIYTVDISRPDRLDGALGRRFLTVPGANGIKVQDGTLYVVSIPSDYKNVGREHVVYRVRVSHPRLEAVDETPGLYDGVAVSRDGKTLYVSDWLTSSISSIDLASGKKEVLYQELDIGPADIALADGVLYVPELLKSEILAIPVGK